MKMVRDAAACTTSFVFTDMDMLQPQDGRVPIMATELARRLLIAAAQHGDRPCYDATNCDLNAVCPRDGDDPEDFRSPRPDWFGIF